MDDMQGQIIYMSNKFRDSISHFDKICSELKELKLHISSSSEESEKLKSICSILKENFNKHEENLRALTTAVKALVENVNFSVLSLRENAESQKRDIETLKVHHDSVKESLKSISSDKISLAKAEDLESLKGEIRLSSDRSSQNFSANVNSLDRLSKEIDRVKLSHSSDIENMKKSHREISSDYDTRLKSMENKMSVLSSDLVKSTNKIESDISNHIELKIASIPKPEIPSLNDVKDSFLVHVEPISFEAKNANLRSSNNEAKIMLLEKKVEHLQLLLNKLQLQG